MGPPTGMSHYQRPGLGKNDNMGRFCQNISVYPCFALACKFTFPLQSQGLTELGKVLLSCSRKAIETHSQAQQVVCWHYSLQHSLGIMKETNEQRSIYGDKRMTSIVFLSPFPSVILKLFELIMKLYLFQFIKGKH